MCGDEWRAVSNALLSPQVEPSAKLQRCLGRVMVRMPRPRTFNSELGGRYVCHL